MQLEEATQTIAREVSTVVGARRASIMVFDEAAGVLRTVAARGFGARGAHAGVGGRRVLDRGPRLPRAAGGGVRSRRSPDLVATDCGEPRGYRGQAFLSVPICYGAPGSPLRCVGVINLTDRLGGDRFTLSDRKLVTAVANQIGAAVENARLVERDRQQQRLRDELELAHDLQLKLLRRPACSRATPRWRRAAIRRTRSAAISTPSPDWGAGGSASCWATWHRTASRPRW